MAKKSLPPIDPKEQVQRLARGAKPADRTGMTFWMSKKIGEEFKAACAPAKSGEVLEEILLDWMRRKNST